MRTKYVNPTAYGVVGLGSCYTMIPFLPFTKFSYPKLPMTNLIISYRKKCAFTQYASVSIGWPPYPSESESTGFSIISISQLVHLEINKYSFGSCSTPILLATVDRKFQLFGGDFDKSILSSFGVSLLLFENANIDNCNFRCNPVSISLCSINIFFA